MVLQFVGEYVAAFLLKTPFLTKRGFLFLFSSCILLPKITIVLVLLRSLNCSLRNNQNFATQGQPENLSFSLSLKPVQTLLQSVQSLL